MKIRVKKLDENAILPKYAHDGDAGMDVFAQNMTITDKYIEYETGLSFEVPKGYVMLIFPRSSVSNKHLMMKNSVGVLDSGYRGELKLRFQKNGEDVYNIGDKIGQIIILPYPEIEFEESESLDETARGSGGFGSTGR
jgi:dUTP pyrophosphatase